jgi:hypothetical protein
VIVVLMRVAVGTSMVVIVVVIVVVGMGGLNSRGMLGRWLEGWLILCALCLRRLLVLYRLLILHRLSRLEGIGYRGLAGRRCDLFLGMVARARARLSVGILASVRVCSLPDAVGADSSHVVYKVDAHRANRSVRGDEGKEEKEKGV